MTTKNFADCSETAPSDFSRFAKMKILIVDDGPGNVALLEALLGESGHLQLKSLTDSRLVLETCETFSPDLILLDIMMPHIDGLQILESLRTQYCEIYLPVIVLTADANEEMKRKALRAGATDFLLKPFDHFEVFLRIANLLESRRLHLQLDIERSALADAVYARTSELREAESELQKVRAESL
jgi:putative two-component system response regulator